MAKSCVGTEGGGSGHYLGDRAGCGDTGRGEQTGLALQLGREWRGCGGGLLRLLLSERGRRVIGLPCPEAWWSLSIGGSGGGWGSMQGLRRDRRSWRQKLAVGKGHPAFRHSWVPPSALPFPSLPPALRSV